MNHTKFTTLSGIIAALSLTGCACMTANKTPDVPDNLKTTANQTLTLNAHAKGVQIYKCEADKKDASKFVWNFKAPEADLFEGEHQVAKHYAGPTWEANDGSKVIGQVLATDKGPDDNAIPWLLLNVISHSGTGAFEHVTSIQRIHTVGGKAPVDGCDLAHAGATARTPYTADYYFYSGNR